MKVITPPKNIFRVAVLGVAMLLALGFTTVAFAGDLNVKIGCDVFLSEMSISISSFNTENKVSKKLRANSLACEYLTPLSDFWEIGIGAEYLFPRKLKEGLIRGGDKDLSVQYLPVYFTLQVNPFKEGLFLKGNIGYVAYFSSSSKKLISEFPSHPLLFKNPEEYGGLYFSLGAGYEFSTGLMVDIMYSQYNTYAKLSEVNNRDLLLIPEFKYERIGINLGYKFDI